MQNVTNTSVSHPLWKRIAAALLLVAFLGIHAIAHSHELHHAVHEDADAAEHACVFVQVSQGQCLAAAPSVSAPAPLLAQSFAGAVICCIEWASRDYVLLPGRAPPAC
jgi:hypothetical protein